MRLILASASPRRRELLLAADIDFDVHAADVDETPRPGESADAYVRRLAEAKTQAVAARFPERPVLGADTTVVVDGVILGKPVDTADAARMLRRLAGRPHEVITGVTLVCPERSGLSRRAETRTAVTTVEFARLSEAEIAWYLRTGEPLDKAGAYGIQGAASRFVRAVHGSYSNVVGLPVALVYEMCREAGILLS